MTSTTKIVPDGEPADDRTTRVVNATQSGQTTTGSINAPAVKGLQYKRKQQKKNSSRPLKIAFVLFVSVCGFALASSGGKEEGADSSINVNDINECAYNTDNCRPNERCENTVMAPAGSSYLCIPCSKPPFRSTPDGTQCILDCPQRYIPSKNNEMCIVDICGTSGELIPQGQRKLYSRRSNHGDGLSHQIRPDDRFGAAVAPMGDLDGNGAVDFAVGAYRDEESTNIDKDFGSIFVIFLNPDNTVGGQTIIGTTDDGEGNMGGLAVPMHEGDKFGRQMGNLGDLDGDGVPELIVGATGDDDGGSNRGALYVLFMLATGTVKKQQKISSTQGGFKLLLTDGDSLGWGVSAVGGVNRENGGVDVVAATGDTVYLLVLNLDGTVKSTKLLKALGTGPNPMGGVAGVGDVDRNGVVDIAIGSPVEDAAKKGAVYILLMKASGGGKSLMVEQRISPPLSTGKSIFFGDSVAGIGDLDGDGTPDLAVGATGTLPEDSNRFGAGAVHILLLNKDGSVKGTSEISSTKGGLIGPLNAGDYFGGAVATLVERGDSEEGAVTLLVGASFDDVSATKGGSVYMLKVPPGFVELCPGENERCINSGNDAGYTCA